MNIYDLELFRRNKEDKQMLPNELSESGSLAVELSNLTAPNKFQSNQLNDLAAALSKAQAEFPPIPKNRSVKVTTRDGKNYSYCYADLSDIIESVKPVLAKHGLSFTQETRSDERGQLWLWTTIMHSSGQWRSGNFPLVLSQRPQDTGSSITYARRYTLCAALGIQAEEDDDGNAASGNDSESNNRKPYIKPVANAPVENRDQLYKEMMAVYKNFMAAYPDANIKVILNNRYNVEETKLLTLEQLKDFVKHLKTEIVNSERHVK
jgi:hypothetical protein